MKNSIASFMKEQRKREALRMNEKEEASLQFYMINKDHDILQEPMNDAACKKLGKAIGCYPGGLYDVYEGLSECDVCEMAQLIKESFSEDKDIQKREIRMDVSYGIFKDHRRFEVSAFHDPNNSEQLILFIEDVSNTKAVKNLNELEAYINNIEVLDMDEIAKLVMAKIDEILSSEFCLFYVLDDQVGFTRPYYGSSGLTMESALTDINDLIDRRLWLQCISGKETVVNNHYEMSMKKKALTPSDFNIKRAMLTPIILENKIMGVLVFANKARPYSRFDINIVEKFTRNILEEIERKREYDRLFKEQVAQMNLVDTIDVGIIRYISHSSQSLKVDYANVALTDMFGLEPHSIEGKSDCFIDYLSDDDLNDFLKTRDLALKEKHAFKWIGHMTIEDQSRVIRFHIIPGHLDDRGFHWEGTIIDMTEHLNTLLMLN